MDDDARAPRRGVSSKGLEVSELTLDPSRRTAGTLHVVATPVGHLDDVTLRAIRVLREVDRVACEDTRQTAKLLRAHGIATPTTSYFEHNERSKGEGILRVLRAGRSGALVSDAGTPGVSDRGSRLPPPPPGPGARAGAPPRPAVRPRPSPGPLPLRRLPAPPRRRPTSGPDRAHRGRAHA